jgi:hypothetical protein
MLLSDHRLYEDWEDMLTPVDSENAAAQGQPQDLRCGGMGHYEMTNNHPPLHEHHDDAINSCAGLSFDVRAQAQAAPPTPVCSWPHCSTYTYLTRHFAGEDRRRLMYLTTQLMTVRLALLERPLSQAGRQLKPSGNSQSSTCVSPIHKLP